ncbi:hypothetical protein G6F60_014450 [Rhizopus arrhizus]|nr:hypothetical protein G6F60_014450 [Rhizopus arrhizus]
MERPQQPHGPGRAGRNDRRVWRRSFAPVPDRHVDGRLRQLEHRPGRPTPLCRDRAGMRRRAGTAREATDPVRRAGRA